MSASADMKLSESVRGPLEVLLRVECLVGDICTGKHKTWKRKKKKEKTKKTKKTKTKKQKKQKQSTNLISFKLVQNISIKT